MPACLGDRVCLVCGEVLQAGERGGKLSKWKETRRLGESESDQGTRRESEREWETGEGRLAGMLCYAAK